LVNTITRGQFQGGTIVFAVQAREIGRSTVEARVVYPVNWLGAMVLPILRSTLRRTLARALAEDKSDLESGNYAG
jgi:hypothetical protein